MSGDRAASDVVVIVDLLSFSTSVEIAVSRGAAVYPYRWKVDSAAAYARERAAELAGSRTHRDGGYSLSPSSLVEAPHGLRLVLPSPNGSNLAFAAMKRGATVVAGCLRNASAVAAWAQRSGQHISIVPAGERWPDGSLRPAVEDLIGSGAIAKRLQGRLSPEALAAVAVFDAARPSLRDTLLRCSSGRELTERGFTTDVELAAELDVSDVVPVLLGEAFQADGGREARLSVTVSR